MGEVITLPVVRVERCDDAPKDGGKARIRAGREAKGLVGAVGCALMKVNGQVVGLATGISFGPDSLTMDHADPETDTRPSEMA